MAEQDDQRLVHEWQVHQIELEMQNEELRKAQEQLGESLEKYSDPEARHEGRSNQAHFLA